MFIEPVLPATDTTLNGKIPQELPSGGVQITPDPSSTGNKVKFKLVEVPSVFKTLQKIVAVVEITAFERCIASIPLLFLLKAPPEYNFNFL